MKKRFLIGCILLLCLVLPSFAASDPDKAEALVDKGIAHVEVVGQKQAAADFMHRKGGFIDGAYYLLFYKYDGTCIALGARPEIAGLNRWDVHDPDGVYQIREMVSKAQSGGGWVKYKYANPVTGEIQKKKTFVQPVPGMDAFIGCGIYY